MCPLSVGLGHAARGRRPRGGHHGVRRDRAAADTSARALGPQSVPSPLLPRGRHLPTTPSSKLLAPVFTRIGRVTRVFEVRALCWRRLPVCEVGPRGGVDPSRPLCPRVTPGVHSNAPGGTRGPAATGAAGLPKGPLSGLGCRCEGEALGPRGVCRRSGFAGCEFWSGLCHPPGRPRAACPRQGREVPWSSGGGPSGPHAAWAFQTPEL